ncbi:MAG: cupin domain-containing protein [Hyphomonadaceae bacterium]
MEINSDFDKRVLIHSDEVDWVASPMAGVDRRMLDRIGGEVARATSIVRYAPGSQFSSHTHDGGEEFVVLEGVFQDEHGDYPAGTYVRNPPTSYHTPGSEPGCIIFVKLRQFAGSDRTSVRTDMNVQGSIVDASIPGVKATELFHDDRETVNLEYWAADAEISREMPDGAEFLVLEGGFEETGERLHKFSWLRMPLGSHLNAKTGADGAKVWVKTRHLRFVDEIGV